MEDVKEIKKTSFSSIGTYNLAYCWLLAKLYASYFFRGRVRRGEMKLPIMMRVVFWVLTGYFETLETVSDFIFWAPKSLQMVAAAMKLKDAYSLEGKLWPT